MPRSGRGACRGDKYRTLAAGASFDLQSRPAFPRPTGRFLWFLSSDLGAGRIDGTTGILNVRFQPYRLQNSRCWSPTDPRISCLSCHNPHENLVADAGFYDSKCLRCHLIKEVKETNADPRRQAPACPVSSNGCIKCHMPRYEFPGGHYAFTDHDIRVATAGTSYPD